MNKKKKTMFVEGAISPEKIGVSIGHHSSKRNIGAHSIFLGQVRADEVAGIPITDIEYTAYAAMADEVYFEIREEVFSKYDLTCAHVYHSLGTVKAGEICFFVFTSSKRRKTAMEACEYFVEEIKNRVPIFGKEILQNDEYQWKVNE